VQRLARLPVVKATLDFDAVPALRPCEIANKIKRHEVHPLVHPSVDHRVVIIAVVVSLALRKTLRVVRSHAQLIATGTSAGSVVAHAGYAIAPPLSSAPEIGTVGV
jgi:hypothetical protein